MSKLVYGVGEYIKGEFAGSVDGKNTKEYKLWQGMLARCYSEKYHATHPAYIGCSVSDNFKNFQYFAEWCQRQIGFNLDGYQLDKDFVNKGNQIYSEYTCFFIPKELNLFLTKSDATRGAYPVGVSFHKATGEFKVRCHDGTGKQKYLGLFTTPEEAFQAYKTYKESLAKQLAIKYNDLVDHRVIEALDKFTVTIID